MKYFIIFLLISKTLVFATDYNALSSEEKEYLKNKKVLKTYVEANWKPFSYVENNQTKGYFEDIIKLFAKKAQLKLDTKTMDYYQAIEELKENNLDIILFLDEPILNESKDTLIKAKNHTLPFILSIASKDGFSNLDELKDKNIGYYEGLEYIFENKSNLVLKAYTGNYDAYKDLLRGNIDAYVEDFNTIGYKLNELNLSKQLKNIPMENQDIVYSYPTVNIENKMLISIFEKLISQEDINSIKTKWDLKDIKNDILNLSSEEKAFLKEKNTFTICDQYDTYPISYVQNEKISGLAGEYYREFEKLLNIKFNAISPSNHLDLNNKVANNQCDLISVITENQTRFKDILETKPMIYSDFVSVGNANSIYFYKNFDFSEHTFYVRFKSFKDEFLKRYPTMNIIVERDLDKIIQNIKENKNSHILTENIRALTYIQKYGFNKFKENGRFTDIPLNIAIGVNKSYPLLESILNKSIEKLGDEFANKTYNKYTLKQFTLEKNYEWLWYLVFFLVLLILLIQTKYIINLKKAKEKEKKLILRYKTIEENTNSYSFSFTPDDMKFHDSKGLERTFELKEEANIKNVFPCIDKKGLEKIQAVIKAGKNDSYTYKITTAKGNIKYLKELVVPFYEDDKLIEFFVSGTDITDRVNSQIEKQKQEALLIKQSRLAQMGEMISMIAHQWRQPLNALAIW